MREQKEGVVKSCDPCQSSPKLPECQNQTSCGVSIDFGPHDIMDLIKLNTQQQQRIATLLEENYDLRMNLARGIWHSF